MDLLYLLDLIGVVVFAMTGVLAAGRKHLDLFGVVVLALVTALGGGTLRDLILGVVPVFWVQDPLYVSVAAGTAVVMFYVAAEVPVRSDLLVVADAFGLAVFTVVGARAAMRHGAPDAIAVMMGVMTGVVGGMLRDVLNREIPLILRREIYATASLLGGILFVGMERFLPANRFHAVVAVAVTLGLRLLALRWNLALPVLSLKDLGRRRG